jgi:hypothetical membrane protein
MSRLVNHPDKTSGTLMFLAGALVLMGIITAEIFYPAGYSTAHNEISDLGATRPPDSIIVQPSATIFNAAMIVSGILLIVASYFVQRAFQRRVVTASILFLGVGMLGVGLFPGNNPVTHPVFALMAFLAAGASAILSASVTSAPFRYIAIILGGITFLFLVLGFFFSSQIFALLGDGGTERWIVYPSLLWILGFGGYLLAKSES